MRLVEKHSFTVGRFDVPYAVSRADGLPLVAINGAQQTMGSWLPLLKFYRERTDFQVVLLDFPGQGRSRILSGPPQVTLDEQLEVLREVVERVAGQQRVYLLGGSWGGVISAAFAARYPDRVKKLILGCFRTSPNAALLDIVRRGQTLYNNQRYKEVAELFVEGFGEHLAPIQKERMAVQLRGLTMDQYEQLYAQSLSFQQCQDVSEYVDLAAIRAETLIVNGDKDPIVDADNTKIAAQRIANCRIKLVKGVGHFLHFEKPEIFQVYDDFFRGNGNGNGKGHANGNGNGHGNGNGNGHGNGNGSKNGNGNGHHA